MWNISIVESPFRSFCKTEVESISFFLQNCGRIRLLLSYNVTSNFWKHLLSWLRRKDIRIENLEKKMFLVHFV